MARLSTPGRRPARLGRAARERGLPQAIRSGNGVPFASPNGVCKMSVWGLRIGIQIERIKPGRPQQNGRHERMHLTLNFLQRQARFDHFIEEFNGERPHEGLSKKTPAEVYAPSRRAYQGLPPLHYPFHDRDVLVTSLHASQADPRLNRARWSEARNQRGRRRHLPHQLHAL